jgi:predicted RNA binding protein YcfA (HicA-like mRNA interferase family)
MKHKGRVISRKKHTQGKKAIKHLRKLGFIAKKGTFRLFKKSDARKTARKSRKNMK